MNQHHESISLAAGIFLIDKKIMDQLWSVWDEMFKVPTTNKYHQSVAEYKICICGKATELKIIQHFVPVDGVNGQDSIAAHITVTVVQAGPDRWHERLKQLGLLQLAQETQSGAADELIGMLQVLKLKERFHDY